MEEKEKKSLPFQRKIVRGWMINCSGALREDAGRNSESSTMDTVTLHYMRVRDHFRLAIRG